MSTAAASGHGHLDVYLATEKETLSCRKEKFIVTSDNETNLTHVALVGLADKKNCVHKLLEKDGLQIENITYNNKTDNVAIDALFQNSSVAIGLHHEDLPAPSHKKGTTWSNTYCYIFYVCLVVIVLLCVFGGLYYYKTRHSDDSFGGGDPLLDPIG